MKSSTNIGYGFNHEVNEKTKTIWLDVHRSTLFQDSVSYLDVRMNNYNELKCKCNISNSKTLKSISTTEVSAMI